ncbi:D-dopachrome decarboxylase isoform X1 [Echeneis naucrates]|uniref:D-dopachrome decarboxylase isoform X1 n=1 Tax=Echeneis naucrates TaxID=173247 RepID=UPI0011138C0E|nr:D-dopachrome decarboxylase-like isoform X1 [Echeneis naucrates]
MPFVSLQTNLPADSLPEDLVRRLSSSAAAALGKPEAVSFVPTVTGRSRSGQDPVRRMNVVVMPGLPMLIAGSCSPCAMLSVSAIGVTDTAEKNKAHSAKMFEFLTKELGLTEDRIVIQFHELQPHQVGKKGTVMSFL